MEFIEIFKEFIKPELLILIPVLYIIGRGLKTSKLKDELIPFILGISSIVLCALYILATSDVRSFKEVCMAIFTAGTQGILIAGTSVYADQLYKQYKKID